MVGQKWTAIDTKPARVATIAGDAEVDHAIARLILASGTDPVARWMYDDPDQYLRHIPQLFQVLGTQPHARLLHLYLKTRDGGQAVTLGRRESNASVTSTCTNGLTLAGILDGVLAHANWVNTEEGIDA
jgi:hypothetical protein